jgi:hypothetical protein
MAHPPFPGWLGYHSSVSPYYQSLLKRVGNSTNGTLMELSLLAKDSRSGTTIHMEL